MVYEFLAEKDDDAIFHIAGAGRYMGKEGEQEFPYQYYALAFFRDMANFDRNKWNAGMPFRKTMIARFTKAVDNLVKAELISISNYGYRVYTPEELINGRLTREASGTVC